MDYSEYNDPFEFHEDSCSNETRYISSSRSSEHDRMELSTEKYSTEDFKIWKLEPRKLNTGDNEQVGISIDMPFLLRILLFFSR